MNKCFHVEYKMCVIPVRPATFLILRGGFLKVLVRVLSHATGFCLLKYRLEVLLGP
jgi:hypothetical protein